MDDKEIEILQNEKTNEGIENLNTLGEAQLLEQRETKDAIKDLETPLEAIALNTAPKEVQKIQIVTDENELATNFFQMLRGRTGEKGERGEKGDTGEKGEKGDKGDKPEKGVDYFTDEDIIEITEEAALIAKPIKGVDYFDGKDGVDGKDGKDGVNGKDGENGKDGKNGKNGSSDTAEKIAEKINTLSKAIDWKTIKNAPEIKGGGSGLNTVFTDGVTITGNGLADNPLVAVGGGGGAFIDLTDVPSSYAGQSGKAVRVNAGESGLEFFAATGSGTVTSVGVSVPTGLTISGSPITTSGTFAIGLDTGRVIPLQSTIDGKVPYTGATANVDLGIYNLITDTITSKTSAGLILENATGGDVLHIGNGGGVNATAYGGWNFDAVTASRVAQFGASKTLESSSVTNTELGYVSGVTSSIQTQLNAKQASIQFQDEGSNLGATGTVDTIDFTGTGVTASRSVNKVTVNITGGGGSGETVAWSVNQTSHGFIVGDAIRSSGVAGQYTKSQADTSPNAEFAGIVTAVADANNFTITTEGRMTTGVPVATAGTIFFISATTAGALTSTPPTTVGQVNKPVLTIITSGSEAILSKERGFVIAAATTAKRVVVAANATSITPNSTNADWIEQANTQAVGTLTINADAGSPTNKQALGFEIKSTNVQTFSWNAQFVGGTNPLPTATTGGGKIDFYTFLYSTTNSKWIFTGTQTNVT